MTMQRLEQQTYIPDQSEEQGVAQVLDFVKAHEQMRGEKPVPQYFLVGAGEQEQVQIPAGVHRALLQVLESLKAGKAVTVAPHHTLVTTQQTAEILGVSRPTVIKLIDGGELPAEIPGKRRRMVKLEDVLACRSRRRDAQYRALLETESDYDDVEGGAEADARMRRVRAEIASARRMKNTDPA